MPAGGATVTITPSAPPAPCGLDEEAIAGLVGKRTGAESAGPMQWAWSVTQVECRTDEMGPWAVAPAGSWRASLVSPNTPATVLSATFRRAAQYRVKVRVSASCSAGALSAETWVTGFRVFGVRGKTGAIGGRVSAEAGGQPLALWVTVRRFTDQVLVKRVRADSDGLYWAGPLPLMEYDVGVEPSTAWPAANPSPATVDLRLTRFATVNFGALPTGKAGDGEAEILLPGEVPRAERVAAAASGRRWWLAGAVCLALGVIAFVALYRPTRHG
jgi:hypothetical protein